MSKADGYFLCRDFRRFNDVPEQRWFCKACGARTVWHLQSDEGEVLSAAGFSTGFFNDKDFEAYCSACKPPSATEREPNMQTEPQETTKPSDKDKRAGKTKVKLKPDQIKEYADNLAHKVNERNELDAKKSTHVKTWNEELRQLDDDIAELAEAVETGWAYVAVQRDWVAEQAAEAASKPPKTNGKQPVNGKVKANGKGPKKKAKSK